KPKDFLIDRRVYVARGEAEFIIQNIVHAINRNRIVDDIKGISFLKMGEMVETESVGIIEDLDRLLPPLRHLIDDKDDYFNPSLKGGPVAPILTSRGSSADAISLAREIEWRRFNDGRKPPVIFRTPKSIAEEFENIKGLGYKAVSVIDDLFLSGGKERVLDICRCLKVVGLPFAIISRCDMILDEEMVAALRNAGCEHVELIIESMDTDTVGRAIELLSKYHIEATANITFGSSPSETTKSMTETIKKVSELPINYCAFKVATPLHPNLSRKDLERAVKRANRKFYLKPSRIWFQLKKIDSLKALKDLIITCWRVIK
ncbi:MAG: hypothetical protein KAS88_03215, partial [Deltaproteobacteria bacterium]|nr:hypothetical protein [Deltaproteobacteria bacterium]